jgi:hypothetical protein
MHCTFCIISVLVDFILSVAGVILFLISHDVLQLEQILYLTTTESCLEEICVNDLSFSASLVIFSTSTFLFTEMQYVYRPLTYPRSVYQT